MLELQAFLRGGSDDGTCTTESALEPIAKGEELLRQYEELCSTKFSLGRALCRPENQEELKSSLQRESESVLPDLPADVLEWKSCSKGRSRGA
jgi:hypothetical protein